MRGVDVDAGAALEKFRKALKAAQARRAAVPGLGVYSVAMAAGRPGLGGFAPVVGAVGGPVGRKFTVAEAGADAASVMARHPDVQAAGTAGSERAGAVAGPSYRTVVAQARLEAEAGRVRRESERAALNLPVGYAGLAGMSFAPPPRAGGEREVGLRSRALPVGLAPGLGRRTSLHDEVTPTESAYPVSVPVRDKQKSAATPLVASGPVAAFDIEQELDGYFFRQSRLPPSSGAGFNPLLSPVWAGLKLPG